MIESGLGQFYASFGAFGQKLVDRHDVIQRDDEDDVRALTVEQLQRPMILIFCLCGVAISLLIFEIIVFKWNQWDPYS